MNRLIFIMALAAIVAIAASCGISKATEADRIRADAYAQATITLANAESMKATAVALTPIVAMTMVGFFALLILGLPVTLFVLFFMHRQCVDQRQVTAPTRIIEHRTIVFLPAAGTSRRQMYQLLGDHSVTNDRPMIRRSTKIHRTQSEVIR